MGLLDFSSFSASFTKWSKTLKQFVGNLPTNCLSVFDHFVGLVLKGLGLMILLFRVVKNIQIFWNFEI